MRAACLLALLLAGCASTPPAAEPSPPVPTGEQVAASQATATRIVESPPLLRDALTLEAWRRAAAAPEVRATCARAAASEVQGTPVHRLLLALAAATPPPPLQPSADVVTSRPDGPLEESHRSLTLLAWVDGAPAERLAALRARAKDDLAVEALAHVDEARAALERLEALAPTLGVPDPRTAGRVSGPFLNRGWLLARRPDHLEVMDDSGFLQRWPLDCPVAPADPFTEALVAPHARLVERARGCAAWLAARLGERLLALALLSTPDPGASARAWLDDLAAARTAELVRDWRDGAPAAEVRERLRPLLAAAAGPDLIVAQELLRGLDAIERDAAGWRPPTWAEWSELGLEERRAAIAAAARAGAFDAPLPADAPPGPMGRPLTTRERLLELGWEGIPTLIELVDAPHPLAKDPSGWVDHGDSYVPTLGSVCAELLRARGLGGLWPDPQEKARAWWEQWGAAGPGAWWTETLRAADRTEFADLAPAARRDAPWVVRATLRARLEAEPDAAERAAWLSQAIGAPPDLTWLYDRAELDDRLALVRLGASLSPGAPLRPGARSHLGRTLRGALAATLAGQPADVADPPDFVATATAALVSDVAAWRDDPRRRGPLLRTALRLGPLPAARLADAGADLRPDLVLALADPARAPQAALDVADAGLWARRWVEEGAAALGREGPVEVEGLAAALGALDAGSALPLALTSAEADPALPGPLREAAAGWDAARALDAASLAGALRAWSSGTDGPPGLLLEVSREGSTTRLRLRPGPAGERGLAFEVRSDLFGRSWARAAAGAPAAVAGHLFRELAAPFLALHASAVTLTVRVFR